MFAFRYSLDCPLCKRTYNSGNQIMLAEGRDLAGKAVLQKHPVCPLCGQDFSEHTVGITIFAADAEAKPSDLRG